MQEVSESDISPSLSLYNVLCSIVSTQGCIILHKPRYIQMFIVARNQNGGVF